MHEPLELKAIHGNLTTIFCTLLESLQLRTGRQDGQLAQHSFAPTIAVLRTTALVKCSWAFK